MARKSGKASKSVKKVLRSLEKSSLLKSRVVLFVTLLISIVVVLMYISKRNWNALITLIAVGVLTNYFTKNMIITMGVPVLVSLLVFHQSARLEGFETEEKENMDTGDLAEGADPDLKQNCYVKNAETGEYERHGTEMVTQEKCSGVPGSCWAEDVTDCGKSKKAGFANKDIPSSKPKRVDGVEDEDSPEGDTIDYSKTLEAAYDNLQNMLGADGIKGLTNETNKLISEQRNLMKSMKNIAPMMNQAKEMMSSLKSMNNMTGLSGLAGKMKGK